MDATAKPVKEAEGGQLYRMSNAYLTVRNGTHCEMPRTLSIGRRKW